MEYPCIVSANFFFTSNFLFARNRCIHTVLLIWLQLGRTILSQQKEQISILITFWKPTDNVSIVAHTFIDVHLEISFGRWKFDSDDLSWSTDFRSYPFKGIYFTNLFKTREFFFNQVQVVTNSSCCLLQVMQPKFGLGWCICKKRFVLCISNIF